MPRSSTKAPPEVYYPESDGQPMGETGIHVNATYDIFATLKWIFLRDRPDVYVAADMFFYYEEGNPKAVKAPDVMVIKGVENPDERRSFKLWVEKKVPCVIFEVTSKDTKRDDTVIKRELYARLGVAEYFLFDPLGEYLKPQLQGYRLDGEHYTEIAPDENEMLASLELGLKIQTVEDSVRFFDFETGRAIPNYSELPEINRLQAEASERLLQELLQGHQLQLDLEREKGALETKKAERERQKAETERLRAEFLEAELTRLRALLEERGIEG